MKYQQHSGERAAVILSACLAALAACTGKIGDPGASAPVSTTAALCVAGTPATQDPGPAFIRRMTGIEYDNTVRDLLGATTPVSGSFPTEEVVLGFNNNAAALTASPALVEQYMMAAEQLATTAVATNMSNIVPCDPAAAGADACEQQFIAAFGQKAYRRPLGTDDTATLTALFDAGKATDFQTGVRLVIEAVLQSPRFLYRVEMGLSPTATDPTLHVVDNSTSPPTNLTTQVVRLDDWEMASRLSYMLWHSMPDDTLLAAAAAGKLSQPADIASQVQRMLQDPKARAMVADFHDRWLRTGEIDTVEKDATVYPAFTTTIAGLMQQEARQFLDHAVWDGAGTLAEIFGAPYTYLNGPLASYYGVSGVSGDAFTKVALDPTQRAGFLTQGGLLSLLAKANQTSPIYRGKFVREQLLCQQLPPPPPNVMIKAPDLSATLTTRQRFTQHESDPACSGCHHLMDPIGFGFEGFDGAGIPRSTENGQPVDVSGRIDNADIAGPFNGVLDLEQKLAGSGEVQSCVTTQWFRYGYGRAETDADACSLQALQQQFVSGGLKITDLLVALTQSKAFLYRRVTPPSGGTQ